MTEPGTEQNPLRVAIIGAGPAGFYAAEHLFKQKDLTVEVDMYDRLPTPFGLVRGGVAPDHQKIKSVTAVYDRTAKKSGFRYFGNVELGQDVQVDDLKRFYHGLVYTTGAQTDRKLGIPGEDLENSHGATAFVAWYNGHPDYRDLEFDLSVESVAVVGVGNVAIDVARILCRSAAELARTDIADYALEALSSSNIKNVYLIGRRGPAQAKFTNPEILEVGEMEEADCVIPPGDMELDQYSQQVIATSTDRALGRKMEIMQEYAKNSRTGKKRCLTLRFLVSPVEILGDDEGKVKAIKLVKNELYQGDDGTLRPRATEETETLDIGMVFRSIGYQGVPLPGVPFYDSWGVILNESGRVIDPDNNKPLPGQYTAGWIKRGPSGVIGTNKPDAVESINCLLADLESGSLNTPETPSAEAAENFVREKQPRYVTYDDWCKLDALEIANGEALGRPRVKFTRIEDMLQAIGK